LLFDEVDSRKGALLTSFAIFTWLIMRPRRRHTK
jgi:hypothetical protein